MAYYLLIRYHVNGGTIANAPSSYSSGITSYSSVTASSSSTYKYFKVNSSSQVTGATSSGGTYGVVGSRFTASSTSTNCNLVDRATFSVTRTGYHLDTDEEYRAGSTSGNVVSQYGGNASKNMPTISRLGGSTSANKTVTVYYNWKANTYTVTYNANGGSGVPGNQTATYNSALTLSSSTTPTRTNYTFLGWSTSSTATSATYTAGQALTAAQVNTLVSGLSNGGTRTLYAVWQANTYTVYFHNNQSNSTNAGVYTLTMTWNATNNNSVTPPTKTGYSFAGFYTAATGGTRVYDSDGDAVDGTYWESGRWAYSAGTTFYAHWTAKSFSYTLNPNGGQYNGSADTASKTVTYGSTTNNSPGIPTRPGYKFKGWYYRVATWLPRWSEHLAYWATEVTKLCTDGTNLYANNGNVWMLWNDSTLSWSATTQPSEYSVGTDSYNTCNPMPSSAPSYAKNYISVNGITYCYGFRETSDSDIAYLFKWNVTQYDKVFDENGQPNTDSSLGIWYNASPTSGLPGDPKYYIRYYDNIYGSYLDSNGLHLAKWDTTIVQPSGELQGSWTDIVTNSSGDANVLIISGNVLSAGRFIQGIMIISECAYNKPANTTSSTSYQVGPRAYYETHLGSATLPNDGIIWVYNGSLSLIAEWEYDPRVFVKVSDTWKPVNVKVKIKINGTWKDVTTLYVKVNGAWKTTYDNS